jgi:hypothetical protein
LTECDDLSEAEAEEMETAVVAVKTAETAEALETAAVTLMMEVLTIKAAAMLVMTMAAAAVRALIEAAVTERVAVTLVMTTAAAVYQRGRWFVSNVSDVRTMWNITVPSLVHANVVDSATATISASLSAMICCMNSSCSSSIMWRTS